MVLRFTPPYYNGDDGHSVCVPSEMKRNLLLLDIIHNDDDDGQ